MVTFVAVSGPEFLAIMQPNSYWSQINKSINQSGSMMGSNDLDGKMSRKSIVKRTAVVDIEQYLISWWADHLQLQCWEYWVGIHQHSACRSSADTRDHSGYGFSQWEEVLLCNAFSDWLSHWQLYFICGFCHIVNNSPVTSNLLVDLQTGEIYSCHQSELHVIK